MSLKAFHIFFITLSALLSVGVGAWGVRGYIDEGDSGRLALGVVFFLCGVALVVYGTRFVRKFRNLES